MKTIKIIFEILFIIFMIVYFFSGIVQHNVKMIFTDFAMFAFYYWYVIRKRYNKSKEEKHETNN